MLGLQACRDVALVHPQFPFHGRDRCDEIHQVSSKDTPPIDDMIMWDSEKEVDRRLQMVGIDDTVQAQDIPRIRQKMLDMFQDVFCPRWLGRPYTSH